MGLKWWQVPASFLLNTTNIVTTACALALLASDLTALHMFASVHYMAFCLTSCGLALVSQKNMVVSYTLIVPLVIGGGLADLVWDCPPIELCLKPMAATAVLVGITGMRKMGARIDDTKLRVRATWYQTGLLALEACVAMLVFACPGVMPLEILELCVWAAFLFNLWYFFRAYRNGVNKTFDSHQVSFKVHSPTSASANSAAYQGNDLDSARLASGHINKELKNAKHKLQTNTTLGIFVVIGIMIVYFFLMNPVWRRLRDSGDEARPDRAAGTCVLREGKSAMSESMSAVDWTKSVMLVTGSIAAHVWWWHTLLIFRASKKRKMAASSAKVCAKKKKSTTNLTQNSGGTGSGSGSGRGGSGDDLLQQGGVSEIERSSVQGD
jgi:hypothetical protein